MGNILALARAAVHDVNGAITLWDATGKHIRDLESAGDSDVPALAFSPDGKALAANYSNGVVRVWDIATAKPWHDIAREKVLGRTESAFFRGWNRAGHGLRERAASVRAALGRVAQTGR